MPQYLPFHLPDVGEGLTEADIVEWKVAVGDTVTLNQNIVEIETAKSLVELPSPHAGRVHELLAQAGDTVDVGSPIVVIDVDPDGEAPAEPAGGSAESREPATPVAAQTGTATVERSEPETSGDVLVGYGTKTAAATRRPRKAPARPDLPAPARATAPDAATQPPAPDAATQPPAPVTGRAPVLVKPPVRKLAKDLGLDLARVRGSGPGGLITREDVEEAARAEQVEALAVYPDDDRPWLDGGVVSRDGRQTRVPIKHVRRRTAEAMVASAFTAPHVTVFTTVDVTRTMRLVRELREDREFADVRVTPLLISMKALILAIRRHPEIGAAWDAESQEIVYKHYVNLGIAAATPRGLVVPNIKNAHRLDLHELAVELARLTEQARAGKTTVEAMREGTVTITNIGVFGIATGTPILNPGESAILAVGSITRRPWVHQGKVKARWVTDLALSFDHRLVDGELGSRVLHDIAEVLADPARAMVWG